MGRGSATAQPAEGGEFSNVLVQDLEAAADDLQDIVRTIITEASADKVVAQLAGDSADGIEARAVAKVVDARLPLLGDSFLAALGVYLQEAEKMGDVLTQGVLLAVRDRVLTSLSAKLPPEMQLLEALLAAADYPARLGIMREAHNAAEAEAAAAARQQGGRGFGSTGAAADRAAEAAAEAAGVRPVPACDLTAVVAAASQFIEDMEDSTEVVGKTLLARLCVIREEVSNFFAQSKWARPKDGGKEQRQQQEGAAQRDVVPQREVAFLKELLAVSDPTARMAYIEMSMRDGWSAGAAGRQQAPGSSKGEATSKQLIRPGRLMSCVSATQARMLAEAERGAPVGEMTLMRMEEVRREVLQVLEGMAQGTGSDGWSAT